MEGSIQAKEKQESIKNKQTKKKINYNIKFVTVLSDYTDYKE